MKDPVDYSKYKRPYAHLKKECGHELHGPEGYEKTYGIWWGCGFRGPVFYLDPDELKLELKPGCEEAQSGASNIDNGYITEALDRCHVICANIDDHLLSHPAVKKYPEIEKLILDGQRLIAEAYQKMGDISVEGCFRVVGK